ncbi:hypothetical protein F4054_16705 [Candidatus Poribacteria bacterium]|nr:hypothetical protein [Candidatus Poribacteria bacterium]MYB94927.1 hypothetical protein [Candidatus Poribacteria bacterium]MYG05979.1 hypothetical protein [Candidatus Poribacteria bacterium]MYK23883.1 hypothetical protein [Candidatus Poribacteria bacterium]
MQLQFLHPDFVAPPQALELLHESQAASSLAQLQSLLPEAGKLFFSLPQQPPSVSVSIGISLPKSPLLSAAKVVTAASPPPQQPDASDFEINPS